MSEYRDTILAPIDLEHINRAISSTGDVGKGFSVAIGIPSIIYKYVPYEIFRHCLPDSGDGTLRATQPLALNDLLDCHVATSKIKRTDGTPWEECLASSLNSEFPSSPPVTAKNLRRRARRYNGDPRISNIVKEKLSRTWGVVSFTTNPLNEVMWGTYADSSSGFVVGYSTELVRPLGVGINKIVYLRNPLKLLPVEGGFLLMGDLRRDRIFESGGNNLGKILFLKSMKWSDEKEVRMVVPLENTECTGKKDKMGQSIRVIRVPTAAIKELYYGLNTPQEEVDRAKKILATGACGACQLQVVETVEGDYGYRARPVL